MAAYAAGGAALLALVFGTKGSGGPAGVAAGTAPVWARMRWLHYAWQLILPKVQMHPPPPPGQSSKTGVWLYWALKSGLFRYLWVPRLGQIQSINGYWIYHSPDKKPPSAPPPSAPAGAWKNAKYDDEGGIYWYWQNTADRGYDDLKQKQFAFFSFHKYIGVSSIPPTYKVNGNWYGSKVVATSPPGLTFPDETDATGKPVYVLTTAQAKIDAQLLASGGGGVSTTAAPAPAVATSSASALHPRHPVRRAAHQAAQAAAQSGAPPAQVAQAAHQAAQAVAPSSGATPAQAAQAAQSAAQSAVSQAQGLASQAQSAVQNVSSQAQDVASQAQDAASQATSDASGSDGSDGSSDGSVSGWMSGRGRFGGQTLSSHRFY